MTERWVPSGKNWMWGTWLGDTQVIYVCFFRDPVWRVVRKVTGAGDPCGSEIGVSTDLYIAQGLAESDAGILQEKGF